MRLAALCLAAVLLSPAALAGTERCSEPFAPVIPDGVTATDEEIKESKREVEQFIADSDEYQACILAVIADPDEKMTPEQKQAAHRLIDDNQREKEDVAAAYNAALRAHKAAKGR
jgi:hypothetical protein